MADPLEELVQGGNPQASLYYSNPTVWTDRLNDCKGVGRITRLKVQSNPIRQGCECVCALGRVSTEMATLYNSGMQ